MYFLKSIKIKIEKKNKAIAEKGGRGEKQQP